VKHVQAVIFDWAGTTVDHGSLAPVRAVTELFARARVPIREDDARRDMGLFKKDHIRRILAMPHVNRAWSERHVQAPGEQDVESLFADFGPLQMKILEAHSAVICGVPELTRRVRERGIRIGSTTGYTRPMLDLLLAHAASQGYAPDVALCPDDVGGGRPHPWMCLRIALEFRISSMTAAIKVGDTVSDIEEGRNAGMWTVGVTSTGNEVGLSAADLAALPDAERQRRIAAAADALHAAGAHYVVENVAALEPIMADIEARIAAGERP
jgi:phosphonoacetaldehyde hydrolase